MRDANKKISRRITHGVAPVAWRPRPIPQKENRRPESSAALGALGSASRAKVRKPVYCVDDHPVAPACDGSLMRIPLTKLTTDL